tara:strand:+ start:2403 stop:2645 length:243 start_codon:yes stop_codon:yes gene_type:complete
MIILLLCIIVFILLFGARASFDIVFWLVAVVALAAVGAAVIGGLYYIVEGFGGSDGTWAALILGLIGFAVVYYVYDEDKS